MKLCLDFQIYLMLWKFDQDTNLPFIKNYITYNDGNIKTCDMWGYLYFMNNAMKRFRKERQFESFSEFMNKKYPPVEGIYD